MKYNLAVLLAASLLSACATPTLTYTWVGAQGNENGAYVMSLPLARISLSPSQTETAHKQTDPAPAAAARHAAGHTGTPNPTAADPSAKTTDDDSSASDASIQLTYEDNPDAMFVLSPQDTMWALTEIAPTYRDNIAAPASVAVETYDRSAQLAQTVASVINAAGDATFLGAHDSGTPMSFDCFGLRPDFMETLLHVNRADDVSAARANALRPASAAERDERNRHITNLRAGQMDAQYWDPHRCYIALKIDAVPRDAIPLSRFVELYEGQPSHVMISSACRRVEIDYYEGAISFTAPAPPARGHRPTPATPNPTAPAFGQDVSKLNVTGHHYTQWIRYIPDPYFVRLSPLPRQGTLTMTNACSPPSLERGADKPPSAADFVNGLLEPFRNSPGEATAPAGNNAHTGAGHTGD